MNNGMWDAEDGIRLEILDSRADVVRASTVLMCITIQSAAARSIGSYKSPSNKEHRLTTVESVE